MPNQVTTDEQTIKLKLKVVAPIVGFLLLVSNGFTRYVSVQNQHTEDIEYHDGATKRRIKNAVEKLRLELEVKNLKHQLKQCKDERSNSD